MSVDLAKRQLVDSIWKSTGIEGLGTTFPSTEAILDNIPVKTTKEEVYFVCNMKRAWEFLFEQLDYPTNLAFLREVNKICMENLNYGAGNIRTVPVSIGGTSWKPEMPNSAVIIEEIRKICDNENSLESALDMFCYIARTQMFIDGNKRLAQLICNKIMIEKDLGIFSIPYEKIGEFKELLIDFYETGDSKDIKGFFLDECLLLTEKGEALKNELKEKDDRGSDAKNVEVS